MRALGAGFGLLALLLGIALMSYLWSMHTSVVVSKGKQAEQTARQFAGYDPDSGVRAKDSIKLEPVSTTSGKLKYVLVSSIVANGAFEKYYGLKQDDNILGTGSMDFRNEDGEMAVELIHRAYQTKDTLIVMREGKKLTLPLPEDDSAPAGAAPAGNGKNALQQQLNGLPGVR